MVKAHVHTDARSCSCQTKKANGVLKVTQFNSPLYFVKTAIPFHHSKIITILKFRIRLSPRGLSIPGIILTLMTSLMFFFTLEMDTHLHTVASLQALT